MQVQCIFLVALDLALLSGVFQKHRGAVDVRGAQYLSQALAGQGRQGAASRLLRGSENVLKGLSHPLLAARFFP